MRSPRFGLLMLHSIPSVSSGFGGLMCKGISTAKRRVRDMVVFYE